MSFRSNGTQNIFQGGITQQDIVEDDLLWSGGGGSDLQEN